MAGALSLREAEGRWLRRIKASTGVHTPLLCGTRMNLFRLEKVAGYCSVPGRTGGVPRRGRYWREGPSAPHHVTRAVAFPEQMSDKSDVSLPPVAQALPPHLRSEQAHCAHQSSAPMASPHRGLALRPAAHRDPELVTSLGYPGPHPGRSLGTHSGGRRLPCWLPGDRLPGLCTGPSSHPSAPTERLGAVMEGSRGWELTAVPTPERVAAGSGVSLKQQWLGCPVLTA